MKKIKLGTRGSPLALIQTHMVRDALAEAYPDLTIEIVTIQTSGDWKPEHGETPLPEREGGKALFAKEIEEALLAGGIDAGVHSMKDMDSRLPEGLAIRHMLPREDARDAVLLRDRSLKINSIRDLPEGFTVGTSSVRRAAFLSHARPDLRIVPLRGNVQTRIDKLRAGVADATLLAVAGLKRLGLAHEIDAVLEVDDLLPCAGQGAVGIEIREGDDATARLLDALNHKETLLRVTAERAALAVLGAGCRTPIAAHADFQGDVMRLDIILSAPRGIIATGVEGPVSNIADTEAIGAQAGGKIREQL